MAGWAGVLPGGLGLVVPGVVVGAGVGQEGGDGAGCVLGEAGPDGDLVVFPVVEGVELAVRIADELPLAQAA
jgi:hypothetical protein